MWKATRQVTRRSFLTAGSVAAVAAAAVAVEVDAGQATAEEASNIAVVNAFCAASVVPFAWEKVAMPLTSDRKYRASQNVPLVERPDAIVEFLKSFAGNATSVGFDII